MKYKYNCDSKVVRFEVDFPNFLNEYIATYAPWLEKDDSKCKLNVDVHSKVEIVKSFKNYQKCGWVKYGDELLVSDNGIAFVYQDWLILELNYAGDTICVTGYVLNSLRRRLKDILKSLSRFMCPLSAYNGKLQYLLRMIFHYPLFYTLKSKHDVSVIHASSININNSSLVFVGLSGVGKSTTAYYLSNTLDSEVLSDNFCLVTSTGYVMPFVESIRLNSDITKKFKIKGLKAINGKALIDVSQGVSCKESIPIMRMFIMKRGLNNRISKVDNAFCKSILESMTFLLPEFSDYGTFCSLLRLLNSTSVLNDEFEFLNKIKISELQTSDLSTIDHLLGVIDE